MANIVITTTTNSIKVDFGAYAGGGIPKKATYNKDHIVKFTLEPSDAYVTAINDGELPWLLAYTATTNCLIVDSIDGNTPSSNSDLYDKLIALIA
jgi:hypothetical protein